MKNKIRDITLGLLIYIQLCAFTWYLPENINVLSITYNLISGKKPITDPYIMRGFRVDGIKYKPLHKLDCFPCCGSYGANSVYFWLVFFSFILYLL
jgi:hypothetical protein